MTEKKPNYNMDIVIRGERWVPAPRSKMISRGLKAAESMVKMPLTIVRDIIVEINNSGYLRRWAIIDPVRIKGERIRELKKVSLGYVFNEKKLLPDMIDGYDVRIGDTVTIDHIFGGINLLKVVKGKRTGNEKKLPMPVKCPACGSKIETLEPDSAYYCTGDACPGRIKAQLIAFSDSMHIDLNPKLAKELVDKRMVSDPADLYFLNIKDLMRLNKMDEDSAQRVLDAIEKSRHPEVSNIIIAFLEMGGIRFNVALELTHYCNSIDDLLDAEMIAQIKPNKYLGIYQDDIIAIQKLINDSKTLKFLEKLKRGGLVFPRRGDN